MTDEVLQQSENLDAATVDEADIMKDFNFDDILENSAADDVVTDVLNMSEVDENVTSEVNEQSEVADFLEQEIEGAPVDNIETGLNEDVLNNQAALSPLDGLETTHNLAYLKVYDGTLSDNMYNIDKNFDGEAFEGTADCDTIHINVGYDTYGWNVEFANGTNMGLRDVREYQKRQGRLPFNSGNITYGQKVLRFSGVNRIVVYESLKYFSYGA